MPDLRILIDNSESMRQSDPNNLRISSLNLLIKLLPNGAKAGVWLFSDSSVSLIPHGVVDNTWRIEALKAVSKTETKSAGHRVNIPEALNKVLYDIRNFDPHYRAGIVLLTDGELDLSSSPIDNAAASRELLREISTNFSEINIPIFTIALTQQADRRFLSKIAAATSGLSELSDTPSELAKIYVSSLDILAGTTFIPLINKKFQVDNSIEEFTLVAFFSTDHSDIEIISPNGRRYNQGSFSEHSAWFRGQNYVMFTQSNPEFGSWSIDANELHYTRITVVSDLSIEAPEFPNSIPVNSESEFTTWLKLDGKRVSDLALLSSLDFELSTITNQKGQSNVLNIERLAPLGSGEFRFRVPAFEKAGRYNLNLNITGGDISRALPNYLDVFALTDSEIDTRNEPSKIASFISPSTEIILGIIFVLLLVSGFLLALRSVSVRRKGEWLKRLSVTNSQDKVFENT